MRLESHIVDGKDSYAEGDTVNLELRIKNESQAAHFVKEVRQIIPLGTSFRGITGVIPGYSGYRILKWLSPGHTITIVVTFTVSSKKDIVFQPAVIVDEDQAIELYPPRIVRVTPLGSAGLAILEVDMFSAKGTVYFKTKAIFPDLRTPIVVSLDQYSGTINHKEYNRIKGELAAESVEEYAGDRVKTERLETFGRELYSLLGIEGIRDQLRLANPRFIKIMIVSEEDPMIPFEMIYSPEEKIFWGEKYALGKIPFDPTRRGYNPPESGKSITKLRVGVIGCLKSEDGSPINIRSGKLGPLMGVCEETGLTEFEIIKSFERGDVEVIIKDYEESEEKSKKPRENVVEFLNRNDDFDIIHLMGDTIMIRSGEGDDQKSVEKEKTKSVIVLDYSRLDDMEFSETHRILKAREPSPKEIECVLNSEDVDRLTIEDVMNNVKFNTKRPPLIFINSCAAGKLEYVGEALNGFAIAFLLKGAIGCIAPTLSVDELVSKMVMCRFYKELLSARGIPIGEALKGVWGAMKHQSDIGWSWYTLYGDPRQVIY